MDTTQPAVPGQPESEPTETPQGWNPGDRAYPYWDERIGSLVYAHHGPWIISVTPTIFNDRVLLTRISDYPRLWTAGFCYDKGPAAGLAAMAWNPLTEPRPAGYKKVANDNRYPNLEQDTNR